MIKIENSKLNFHGQTCEIGHVFECNHEYNGKAALFAMFDFEAEITRINKKSITCIIRMNEDSGHDREWHNIKFTIDGNKLVAKQDGIVYIELF